MTDEKKKPEEDEVSDEQLEDVAGGTLQETFLKDMKETDATLDVQKKAIAKLTDSIKDMAGIQKSMFDSTNATTNR